MMTFFSTPIAQVNDYLVRINLTQLDSLELIHLYSEVDPAVNTELYSPPYASLSGYTEWMALHLQQTVTLGWDWISNNGGRFTLRNGLLIRTNLMLQDHRGTDLGREVTLMHLLSFINRFEWQESISRHLKEQCHHLH